MNDRRAGDFCPFIIVDEKGSKFLWDFFFIASPIDGLRRKSLEVDVGPGGFVIDAAFREDDLEVVFELMETGGWTVVGAQGAADLSFCAFEVALLVEQPAQSVDKTRAALVAEDDGPVNLVQTAIDIVIGRRVGIGEVIIIDGQ